MEEGVLAVTGALVPTTSDARIEITIPGEATSRNPLKAFCQGLAGSVEDRTFVVMAYRCDECGAVELVANVKDHVESMSEAKQRGGIKETPREERETDE